MLYHLFEYLKNEYGLPGAGLFQFSSFRAGLAVILSLLISMIFGKYIVRWLQKLQVKDEIRQLGLKGENLKAGTPTMGGIIILLATFVPAFFLARLDNIYVLMLLFSLTWLAMIGFADDYIKVFKKDKEGLKGIFKILGQVGLGLIVGVTMLWSDDVTVRLSPDVADKYGYEVMKTVHVPRKIKGDTIQLVHAKAPITNVPFLKNNELDYSRFGAWMADSSKDRNKLFEYILFVLMTIFIVTAVSNGANLTDGLDGLAVGVSAIVILTLLILAFVSGNALAADYLNILYIPGSSEIVIFAACLLGGCIGFLWYNVFPARAFMGDTGSLALGGIIAAIAIMLRKELLIPLLCGVFLIENLSVMLQVWYFKRTRKKYGEGRRIFLMSPLHHHYQKKGFHEVTIVVRFWIVQILLAVAALITLKIR